MKKKTLKYYKKKAWAKFSKYIRLKYADKYEYCTCVTCGTKKHWRRMQAGHFVPGRNNSILFDERNVHVQCVGCNMFKNGNTLEYLMYMERTYGREVVDELMKLSKQPKKITIEDYKEMTKEYDTKIKELENAGNQNQHEGSVGWFY